MTAPRSALVFGGSGGIGSAVIRELNSRFPDLIIFATYRATNPTEERPGYEASNVYWYKCDIRNESELILLEEQVRERLHELSANSEQMNSLELGLDLIINTVGMLHADQHMPEKTIAQFDTEFFMQNIRTNTLPSLLIAKIFRGIIKKSKACKFATVSARVGSIEDNRLGGWTSYRCSKAALNMAIKTVSLEWKRSLPQCCILAFHPGTTDTKLSQPFQRNVPKGKLFSPELSAGYLLDLLGKVSLEDSGKFFAWDMSEIPW